MLRRHMLTSTRGMKKLYMRNAYFLYALLDKKYQYCPKDWLPFHLLFKQSNKMLDLAIYAHACQNGAILFFCALPASSIII